MKLKKQQLKQKLVQLIHNNKKSEKKRLKTCII